MSYAVLSDGTTTPVPLAQLQTTQELKRWVEDLTQNMEDLKQEMKDINRSLRALVEMQRMVLQCSADLNCGRTTSVGSVGKVDTHTADRIALRITKGTEIELEKNVTVR